MSAARAGEEDLLLHLNEPQSGGDEEIRNLYEQLQRLDNTLKRTRPQARSNVPVINSDDIGRIRLAIKTRFILHEQISGGELDRFIVKIQGTDDDGLLEFSDRKLKSLLAKLRTLPLSTWRRRIYMTSGFHLPEPALTYPGSQDTATMLVSFYSCRL
jgi:hypothetical protein